MALGDEVQNREAIMRLPDESIVLVWFTHDTEPRVLVKRDGSLRGAYSNETGQMHYTSGQMHYTSQWTNGHAWHFDRHEVIWTPPVDERQRVRDLLALTEVEPDWLIDLLGEHGLTITERTP